MTFRRRLILICGLVLMACLAWAAWDIPAAVQSLALLLTLAPVAWGQTSYWTLNAELDRHLPLQDDADNTDIAVYEDGVAITAATLSGGDNTSAKTAAGPGGHLPKAIEFNGTDDHITVDFPEIGTSQQYTVAWRMRAAADAANTGVQTDVWAMGGGAPGSARWLSDNTNFARFTRNSGGSVFIGLGATSGSTWHAFAAKWDGTNIVTYLNGAEQSSAAVGAAGSPTTSMVIGARTGSTAFYAGRICDFAMWYRSLTQPEVAQWHAGPEPTYTSGATLTVRQSTITGTVGDWEDYDNGDATFEWKVLDEDFNEIASGTGDTIAESGLTNLPGLYTLHVRATNDGGYDVGDGLDGEGGGNGYYKVAEYNASIGSDSNLRRFDLPRFSLPTT